MIDEKTKKILKVVAFVVGLFLIYSFFNLFFGGGANMRKVNLNVENDNAINSSIPRGGLNSAGMGTNDAMVKSAPMSAEMVTDSSFGMSYGESVPLVDKKIIKNGDLDLKIESASQAADEISNIAKQFGGEVFSTNFRESVRGQKSGYMTVKVPVAKFEETMGAIKKVAVQVISEATNGQDVTEQYSDLQAQLKNKKAEEESFVKILGTAGKIDDVLSATREVARVRGEIERLEGKIRFMNSQTDMSTITVNLSEDAVIVPVNDGWRPWQVVKQSFRELVSNIQDAANGIIRFIIVGIPSLLPFLLLAWILYWVGKKIFNKINS